MRLWVTRPHKFVGIGCELDISAAHSPSPLAGGQMQGPRDKPLTAAKVQCPRQSPADEPAPHRVPTPALTGHISALLALRGDPEDPHRTLVVPGRHAARLRHHQRLPRACHGAPDLHGRRVPHREVLPLPQGRRRPGPPLPHHPAWGSVTLRRASSHSVHRCGQIISRHITLSPCRLSSTSWHVYFFLNN